MSLDECIAIISNKLLLSANPVYDDPRLLQGEMSRLSEDTWSAGWASECEYIFWHWIVTQPIHCELSRLLTLATMARCFNGWWHDEEFVRLDKWKKMYEAWLPKQKALEEVIQTQRVICPKCSSRIEKYCWCGVDKEKHGSSHLFTPYGCECFRKHVRVSTEPVCR
jgi:hypothetical protein